MDVARVRVPGPKAGLVEESLLLFSGALDNRTIAGGIRGRWHRDIHLHLSAFGLRLRFRYCCLHVGISAINLPHDTARHIIAVNVIRVHQDEGLEPALLALQAHEVAHGCINGFGRVQEPPRTLGSEEPIFLCDLSGGVGGLFQFQMLYLVLSSICWLPLLFSFSLYYTAHCIVWNISENTFSSFFAVSESTCSLQYDIARKTCAHFCLEPPSHQVKTKKTTKHTCGLGSVTSELRARGGTPKTLAYV